MPSRDKQKKSVSSIGSVGSVGSVGSLSSGGIREEMEQEGYDSVRDAPRKEDVKDSTFIGWPLKKEDCLKDSSRFMALWNGRTSKQLSVSYMPDSGGIISVRDARKGKNANVVYTIYLRDHGNDWKRALTKADADLQAKCPGLGIKLQKEDKIISEISEQERRYQMTYGIIRD